MVTDFVLGVITEILLTVLDTLPVLELPGWASTTAFGIQTVLYYASSMGAWMPVGFTATVALAVLAAYGLAFAIKLARIVASFLTAGGGSAA